jgi:hypothetical protein
MRRVFWKLAPLAALLVAAGTAGVIGAGAGTEAAHGLDVKGMDRTLDPGDDFYGTPTAAG